MATTASSSATVTPTPAPTTAAWAVALLRLGFGLFDAAALGFAAYRADLSPAGLVNYFCYFTILSNICATLVLLAGAAEGLLPIARRSGFRVPDALRGAATLYMAITGLVYVVALSSYTDLQTIPWTNDVVHHVMPLVMLADWLIVPPRSRIPADRAAAWLIFPIAYLVFTLIRGPIARWYPYPFVDPTRHGYAHVAVSCLLVAVAFVVIGALLAWLGNLLADRRTRRNRDRPRAAARGVLRS
jgi:hypothetical protein